MPKTNLINLVSKSEKNDEKKEKEVEKLVDDKELKAKEKVKELLKDIDLLSDADKKVVSAEIQKGTEWLEDQINVLSEKNTELEKEAAEAKENYKKLFADFQKLKEGNVSQADSGEVNKKVVQLFLELQDNYNKLGRNFIVYFPAFLNRMIMFFPFLQKHKNFK